MDDDYSATPGEEGSLPRVQWSDGTTHDGSAIAAILERIEEEHPHAPNFFPRISVTVAVVRDSLRRFDAIMPRFTRPSSLAPYVYACKIQRADALNPFEAEVCEVDQIVPRFKYEVCLEEIDEIMEEYSGGPFISGEAVTAADIYWAPYLERLNAYVPTLHRGLKVRSLHITLTLFISSFAPADRVPLQPRVNTVAASSEYGYRFARECTTRSPSGSMPWTRASPPTRAASRGEPPLGSRFSRRSTPSCNKRSSPRGILTLALALALALAIAIALTLALTLALTPTLTPTLTLTCALASASRLLAK